MTSVNAGAGLARIKESDARWVKIVNSLGAPAGSDVGHLSTGFLSVYPNEMGLRFAPAVGGDVSVSGLFCNTISQAAITHTGLGPDGASVVGQNNAWCTNGWQKEVTADVTGDQFHRWVLDADYDYAVDPGIDSQTVSATLFLVNPSADMIDRYQLQPGRGTSNSAAGFTVETTATYTMPQTAGIQVISRTISTQAGSLRHPGVYMRFPASPNASNGDTIGCYGMLWNFGNSVPVGHIATFGRGAATVTNFLSEQSVSQLRSAYTAINANVSVPNILMVLMPDMNQGDYDASWDTNVETLIDRHLDENSNFDTVIVIGSYLTTGGPSEAALQTTDGELSALCSSRGWTYVSGYYAFNQQTPDTFNGSINMDGVHPDDQASGKLIMQQIWDYWTEQAESGSAAFAGRGRGRGRNRGRGR